MPPIPLTPTALLAYAGRAADVLEQHGLTATSLHLISAADPFIQATVPLADLLGAASLAGFEATRSPAYGGAWTWTVVVDGVRIVAEEPASTAARKAETRVLGASEAA